MMPNPELPEKRDTGVWCLEDNEWFTHFDGDAIRYTQSEAVSIAHGLQLMFPKKTYEPRPLETP
jgi:hypothetical protein